MVEIRRGSEGEDRLGLEGLGARASGSSGLGERLPWLEPVEDEDDGDYGPSGQEPGGGYGGVMLAALVVLIAIAGITAGVVWFRHHRAATADIGEVIHPEPGPYKIKPPVAGGLDTDATGQVAAGTSAGEDIDSVLDLNAVPEQPVATRARPGAAPAPAQPQQLPSQMPIPQAPQAKPAPAAPAAPPPKPAPTPAKAPPVAKEPPVAKAPLPEKGGGSTIQLGAFSTEAKAKSVWKSLTSRFHYLQDMTPVVLPVASGDAKLFRLRATGGPSPAGQVCGQLRVAGETCAVVGQ